MNVRSRCGRRSRRTPSRLGCARLCAHAVLSVRRRGDRAVPRRPRRAAAGRGPVGPVRPSRPAGRRRATIGRGCRFWCAPGWRVEALVEELAAANCRARSPTPKAVWSPSAPRSGPTWSRGPALDPRRPRSPRRAAGPEPGRAAAVGRRRRPRGRRRLPARHPVAGPARCTGPPGPNWPRSAWPRSASASAAGPAGASPGSNGSRRLAELLGEPPAGAGPATGPA